MKIIKPNSLIQLDALRSNCDIVWLTGAGGSGKTYIACAYNSMDILEDPKFKAVYVRKNVSQFFATGGIADTLEEIYPLIKEGKRPPKMPIGTIVQTPTKMGAYFKSGASLKFMSIIHLDAINYMWILNMQFAKVRNCWFSFLHLFLLLSLGLADLQYIICFLINLHF